MLVNWSARLAEGLYACRCNKKEDWFSDIDLIRKDFYLLLSRFYEFEACNCDIIYYSRINDQSIYKLETVTATPKTK